MLAAEVRGGDAVTSGTGGQLSWLSTSPLRDDLILLAPDTPLVHGMLDLVQWPRNRTRFLKREADVR